MNDTTVAMKAKCPHCGQRLAVDSDMLGEVISCPGCSHQFRLPTAPIVLMSTTDAIPGERIEEHCGIVSAVVVLGSNAVADIAASLSDIFGGKSDSYTKVFDQGRNMVLMDLTLKAKAMNADAIVGLRLDYETVKDTMMMVAGTGTAVRLAE